MPEQRYTVAELAAHGLMGPPHCTCLEDFPVLGPSDVFCSYCDAIEAVAHDRMVKEKGKERAKANKRGG